LKVNTKINDLENGKYSVGFVLTWEGVYKISANVEGRYINITNKELFASVRCPSEKPWYCVNGAKSG